MKSKTMYMLVVPAVLLVASAVFAAKVIDAVGTYELQGVMEMAGSLIVKPDHTYEAGFSYGAADWAEEGAWKQEGNDVVLSRARFVHKNAPQIQLMLVSGTRFTYADGRLVAADPARRLVFIDPQKTPSRRTTTGRAGEGRMSVRGEVVKLDDKELVVKSSECIAFDVTRLSPAVLGAVRGKQGKTIDMEIPYSAIISGGSCP